MFDILITIAPKDFNKLRFVQESIEKNIEGFHNVFIISPEVIHGKYVYLSDNLLLDEDILDFDFSKIEMENRRGWYRQQFIKLFQEVTADNYLVVDADAYINKKLYINPAHPDFYIGKDQCHPAYFKFLKEVLNLDRVHSHSFISEMMFFKRGIIHYMLSELKMNKYRFFDVAVKKINEMNDASGFSEYELYGNYVTKNWSDLYNYKRISVLHHAKKRQWTDEEIKQCIKEGSKLSCDLITMHSWM